MGRKPLKKIKLTDKEHLVVEKIALNCKVGWFSIAGDTIDAFTGEVCNCRQTEYDECYDLDAKRYISLQFGLRLLSESYGDIDLIGLTDEEKNIWSELLERIK